MANPASKQIRIAMINIMSMKKGRSLLDEWAQDNQIDILVLTEVKFNKEDYNNTGVVKCLGSACEEERVQVRVYTQEYQIQKKYASSVQVVVKIKGEFVLEAWYVPHSYGTQDLKTVEKLLSKHKKDAIVLGDMNANSTWAGGKYDNERGRKLATAAKLGGLVNMNKKSCPTFRRAGTSPDWVLVGEQLENRTEMTVLDESDEWDHNIIMITVKSKSQPQQTRTIIKPTLFIREVRKGNTNDPQDWNTMRQNAIKAATKPAKSRKVKTRIEDMIHGMRRKIARTRRTAKSQGGETKEQTSSIQRLREAITQAQASARVMEPPRNREKRSVPSKKATGRKIETITQGNVIKSGSEAAKAVLQYHYPEEPRQQTVIPPDLELDDMPFTHMEVNLSLSKTRDAAAPGGDNISFGLLKQWHAAKPGFFHKLFNSWFMNGHFPDELKTCHLTIISKNEATDPEPADIRPIGRPDTTSKWFEIALDRRLMWHLETRSILSQAQHGYRECKSTSTAILELIQTRAINKVQEIAEITVALDIKNAFTRIHHRAIIEKMVKYQLPGNMIKTIDQYLTGRQIVLTCGGETESTPMSRGIVQGSVLGPHLYVMTTNDAIVNLESRLKSKPRHRGVVVTYADDVVISLGSARNIHDAIKTVTRAIHHFAADLQQLGLSINPDKTSILIARAGIVIDEVKIFDRTLKTTEQFTFLGVAMHKDMSNEPQIAIIKERFEHALSKTAHTIGPGAKSTPKARRTCVQTMIIPGITYGAAGWYSIRDRTVNAFLQDLSTDVMRKATGAGKLVGRNAATILARMLPLDKQVAVIADVDNALARGEYNGVPIEGRATIADRSHPAEWTSLNLGPTIRSQEQAMTLGPETTYYTDGSRKHSSQQTLVGAAVVRKKDGRTDHRTLKLPPHASVFQAEAAAIQEALDWAAEDNEGDITIVTDSLSVLTALRNPTNKGKTIVDMQRTIEQRQKRGLKVMLHHCRAHQGIQLNEEADEYAKEAAEKGKMTMAPVSRAYVKKTIADKKWAQHEEELKTSNWSGLRKFVDGPRDPRLNKMQLGLYTTQVYSGCGVLGGVSWRDKVCRCGSAQSYIHVLTDCPLFIETNVEIAQQKGIPPDVLLGPWEELANHKFLHHYIGARAAQVIIEMERAWKEENPLLMNQGSEVEDTTGPPME